MYLETNNIILSKRISSTNNTYNLGENCPIWYSLTYLKLSERGTITAKTKHGSDHHQNVLEEKGEVHSTHHQPQMSHQFRRDFTHRRF